LHHDLNKAQLIKIIYEGIDVATKTLLESTCHDALLDLRKDEAWTFLEDFTKRFVQWKSSMEHNGERSLARGIHNLDLSSMIDAKLSPLIKKLDVLSMNKP
jgi:hypothetical protein